MDIPGRSVDATLNIQAKTTGLSETAESLTEVRDALSEVAAVSEVAEQQLDGVNDELSRSETEASTAAGGFTALAASMATASQAAESLDDNLDDIDGASVDAFLPTPGDVDDRVRDIEDRISDIDVEDSIDFSRTLTTDGGIDRGDDILTDGGDDVAEEIGEEYEESVEDLVDKVTDKIDDTDVDQLSRKIDEAKEGKTKQLSDALEGLTDDEKESLASDLKMAGSFQEEFIIVAAEIQRSLDSESRELSEIADGISEAQDGVSDSADRIEQDSDNIQQDRARAKDALLSLTQSRLVSSLSRLFSDDDFETGTRRIYEFTDQQEELSDALEDAKDAVRDTAEAAEETDKQVELLDESGDKIGDIEQGDVVEESSTADTADDLIDRLNKISEMHQTVASKLQDAKATKKDLNSAASAFGATPSSNIDEDEIDSLETIRSRIQERQSELESLTESVKEQKNAASDAVDELQDADQELADNLSGDSSSDNAKQEATERLSGLAEEPVQRQVVEIGKLRDRDDIASVDTLVDSLQNQLKSLINEHDEAMSQSDIETEASEEFIAMLKNIGPSTNLSDDKTNRQRRNARRALGLTPASDIDITDRVKGVGSEKRDNIEAVHGVSTLGEIREADLDAEDLSEADNVGQNTAERIMSEVDNLAKEQLEKAQKAFTGDEGQIVIPTPSGFQMSTTGGSLNESIMDSLPVLQLLDNQGRGVSQIDEDIDDIRTVGSLRSSDPGQRTVNIRSFLRERLEDAFSAADDTAGVDGREISKEDTGLIDQDALETFVSEVRDMKRISNQRFRIAEGKLDESDTIRDQFESFVESLFKTSGPNSEPLPGEESLRLLLDQTEAGSMPATTEQALREASQSERQGILDQRPEGEGVDQEGPTGIGTREDLESFDADDDERDSIDRLINESPNSVREPDAPGDSVDRDTSPGANRVILETGDELSELLNEAVQNPNPNEQTQTETLTKSLEATVNEILNRVQRARATEIPPGALSSGDDDETESESDSESIERPDTSVESFLDRVTRDRGTDDESETDTETETPADIALIRTDSLDGKDVEDRIDELDERFDAISRDEIIRQAIKDSRVTDEDVETGDRDGGGIQGPPPESTDEKLIRHLEALQRQVEVDDVEVDEDTAKEIAEAVNGDEGNVERLPTVRSLFTTTFRESDTGETVVNIAKLREIMGIISDADTDASSPGEASIQDILDDNAEIVTADEDLSPDVITDDDDDDDSASTRRELDDRDPDKDQKLVLDQLMDDLRPVQDRFTRNLDNIKQVKAEIEALEEADGLKEAARQMQLFSDQFRSLTIADEDLRENEKEEGLFDADTVVSFQGIQKTFGEDVDDFENEEVNQLDQSQDRDDDPDAEEDRGFKSDQTLDRVQKLIEDFNIIEFDSSDTDVDTDTIADKLVQDIASGVGEKTQERIESELGIRSISDVSNMTLEDLKQVPGIGDKTAQNILLAQAAVPDGSVADIDTDTQDETRPLRTLLNGLLDVRKGLEPGVRRDFLLRSSILDQSRKREQILDESQPALSAFSAETDSDTETDIRSKIDTDQLTNQLVQDIVSGVGKKTQERLEDELGVRSLSDVDDITLEELKEVSGIGDETAQRILMANAAAPDNKSQETFSKLFALSELSDFASVRDADTSIFEKASDADVLDTDVSEETRERLKSEFGVSSISDINDMTHEELKQASRIGENSASDDVSNTSSRAAFLQAAGADRDAVDDAQVEEVLPTFNPSGGTLDEKFNRTQFPRDLSHLDELPQSLRGETDRPFSGSISMAQSALNTDLVDVDPLKPGQGGFDEGLSAGAVKTMMREKGVFTVRDIIDKGPENIAVTDTQEDILRQGVADFISNAILDINEDEALDLADGESFIDRADREKSFETTAGELVDPEEAIDSEEEKDLFNAEGVRENTERVDDDVLDKILPDGVDEVENQVLDFEQSVDRFVNFSQQESIARAKEEIRQSPEITNARIADSRIADPGEQQTLTDAFSQRVQELGAGDPTEFNILERLIASKKRNDIEFGSMGPGERKGGVFTDVPGEIIRSADTDTNVDLKTGFDRAENLVKSMNVKGTFEQPENADQLNRMLHGGMLVTDGSEERFVPPNAPDPTDIPDGMDRPSDPTPERVLANKFLRLASQSSVFDASLSDFDERVDESNIDGPRTGDVATEFARLGRTKTLEDARFVDRDEITDVIKDAAAAEFEEDDIFQSESPTDIKDIVQQNDEELFDKDIATDVFQRAIRKDGGLTKPNINEAIDEVRGGELAEQEAQFESTLRKLSEFKDTTLNVDNAMESLIDSTETAEIDLEDASEEIDRLNEALTDAFFSDDTFLPFSPDGDADPDRSDLDPEDTPNLRDLLRVFDDLNQLIGSESIADKNLTLVELEKISSLITDLSEDDIEEMDKDALGSEISDASENVSDEDVERLRESELGSDVVDILVEDDGQFAGMGESRVDRNVADALEELAEELSDVFSDVTEDNVDMSSEDILSLLSKDRVTEDERERQVQELGENLAQSVDVIEAARDNVIDIMTEQGGIDEDEAESEFKRILRDADGFGTDALDTAVSERFETQDRFGPDAADRVGAELMSFVNAIRALEAFNPEEENELGLTLVDDERMLIEDVLGMSDRVDTDGLERAELERRSRGDPLERLFNSRVSDQSPPEEDLLDLLVTGAEDGDVQETIEKTFERGFDTGDFKDIQNVLDELRKTAETEEEGADVARLRSFVDKFEQQFFDIAGKELVAGNIDGFDVDDARTNVDAVRPEEIGERSRVIGDAFNIDDIGQRRVLARTMKNLQEQGSAVGVETLRASLAQQSFETDSDEMRKIIDELIGRIDSGKIGAKSVLLDDRTQDRFEEQVQRTIANTSVEGEGEDLARQLIQDVTEAFDDNDRLIAIQDLFDDDRPSVRDVMELDDDDLDNVDADIEEIFTALQNALLVTNRLEQVEVAPDVDQLDVDEEVSARKVRREAEKARIGLGSRQTLDAETSFARTIRQGILANDIDEIDGLDDESGIVSRIFSIGNAMRFASDKLKVGDDAALNVSRSLGSFGRALEELKPELGITSASLGAFNISLRNATGVVVGLTGVLGPLISTVAGLAGAFLTLGGAVGAFVGVGALGFLDDLANRMADVKNRTEAAEKLFKAFREEAIQRLDPLRNVSLTIDGQEVGPQELFASGVLESLDVINQFASISANILELRAVENAIGRIMTAFTTSDGDLTLNEALMEFSEELAPTIADMTVFLINNLPELISFLGDVAKTLDQPLGELFIQAVDLAATLTKIGTGAIAVYAKLADVFLKIVNFLGVIISKLGIISDISPVPELFAEGGAVERGPTAEGRMESDDDGGFLPFSLATGFGGAIGLALGLDALTSLVKRVTNSVRRVGMAKNRIGEAIARARGLTIPKSVGGFLSGAKSLLLPGTNTAGGQTASASRAGLQQTARQVGPNSASRLGGLKSSVANGIRSFARNITLRSIATAPKRGLTGMGEGMIKAGSLTKSIGTSIGGRFVSGLHRLDIVRNMADEMVQIGLPRQIGPQFTLEGALGKALSTGGTTSDIGRRLMTDGGVRQSGLSRLSNLFGRVPTKLDDIISAIQTVDVSINSLDEILAKGKTGVKQGAGILARIGGKRALLGAGGILTTLGTILTRGKGKGLINLLKGGKTGMIGSLLGKITGISALRRPGIGKISKGIMGLGKKVLPKALTGALSSGTSSLFKFLGSKGLKSLAQKGGFTMLTKLFAGRAAMAIPVIGQLIGALDLLTMAITLAIPGVEMFSPLTFAMEQLFNATKDFIDFISELTLDDIIDALSSGGSQDQGGSMPAGPGQRVNPGVNSTQTQPRNPNSPQQQPGMNQSRSANQNTTQTGQGRRPRRDVTINVNGAGENTEGIVTKIMNRLQTEEQKNERFYRGNGS